MRRYNPKTDRLEGHDYPGVHAHGFVQFELDELELGARAATMIDDPEQWWWELIGYPMMRRDGSNTNEKDER